MRLWRSGVIGVFLLAPASLVPAWCDNETVVAATYGPFSVSPPSASAITICHGFGCKSRTEIALTAGDRATLTKLLASGKASAEAERKAIGAAGAWFDKRVAPEAGTVNHVRMAGARYMYDPNQYDCIDSSRNTTTLLLVLDELKLLRHHTVDVPVSRGLFLDGRPPHTTAVLIETKGGEAWSVDSWTRGYGEAPEVMRLSVWKTLK